MLHVMVRVLLVLCLVVNVGVLGSLVWITLSQADSFDQGKSVGVQEFWLNVWDNAKDGNTFYYQGHRIVPWRDGKVLISKEEKREK